MTTLATYDPPSRLGKKSGRSRDRSPSHRWLLLQLRRLLAKSSATNSGSSFPPEVPDANASEWEDDEFAYFHYEIPGRLGPDIDISFHGGIAMVRVEKEPRIMSPPRNR